MTTAFNVHVRSQKGLVDSGKYYYTYFVIMRVWNRLIDPKIT
jgi:hypothetical protein